MPAATRRESTVTRKTPVWVTTPSVMVSGTSNLPLLSPEARSHTLPLDVRTCCSDAGSW